MISVRIVTCDYYMCYPIKDLDDVYNEFRGVEVKQVPVIQLHGCTKTGQKTCVNIHGVYPYIYIPYDGSEPAGNLCYRIAAELDKAINVSLGQGSSNAIHVHNIVLVNGTPFYGYHEKQHQFLKIYFYNPILIQKARPLLENGGVISKYFQPHEAHLSYILQFMIDYNLHGMSFINLSDVMYRRNPEYYSSLEDVSPNLILPSSVQQRSVSKLEIDAKASSILNKYEVSGSNTANPGILALWNDEKQRRRDKNMDSQISFCLTQDRQKVEPTATHNFFANELSEKLSQTLKEDTSLDLDKSVYPVETPNNSEFLNASEADNTILDSTITDETVRESQQITLNEFDKNLLKMLQDLKENAAVEDDSILSQKFQQDEVDYLDEEVNLSLPLNKIITDDDSIWENSFWNENVEISSHIPQIDGQNDIDISSNNVQNENINFGNSEFCIRKNMSVYKSTNNSKIGEFTDSYIQTMIQSLKINNYRKDEAEKSFIPSHSSDEDVIINDVSLGTKTPTSLKNLNYISLDLNSTFRKQAPLIDSSNSYVEGQFCDDSCILNDNTSLEISTCEKIREKEPKMSRKFLVKDKSIRKNQQKLHSNLTNAEWNKRNCLTLSDLSKTNQNMFECDYIPESSLPKEIFNSSTTCHKSYYSSTDANDIKSGNEGQILNHAVNNTSTCNNNITALSISVVSLDGQMDTSSDSSLDEIFPKRIENDNKQCNTVGEKAVRNEKRKRSRVRNVQKMKQNKNSELKLNLNKQKKTKHLIIKEKTHKTSKQENLTIKELQLCLVPLELMVLKTKEDKFQLKSEKLNLNEKLVDKILNLRNTNLSDRNENEKLSEIKYKLRSENQRNEVFLSNLSTAKKNIKLKKENSLMANLEQNQVTMSIYSSSDNTNITNNVKNKRKRVLSMRKTVDKDIKINDSDETKIKTLPEIKNKELLNLCKDVTILTENLILDKNEQTNKINTVQNKRVMINSEKNNIQTKKQYSLRTRNSSSTEILNKSPVRLNRNKGELSLKCGPKYSPLSIIKKSPKKHFNVQKDSNDYEPITKRLRSEKYNTLLNSTIVNNKERRENSQGIGELQMIPILPEKILKYNLSTKEDKNTVISKDIAERVKKKLFDNIDNLDTTTSEEFQACTFEKASKSFNNYHDVNDDINILREAIISNLRNEEEIFLNEIEAGCIHDDSQKLSGECNCADQNNVTQNGDIINLHITEQVSNSNTLNKLKADNTNSEINQHIEKFNEINDIKIKPKFIRRKDKKPVTPIKTTDFDFYNKEFITPEKNAHSNTNIYNPRETLSQQSEKNSYCTKITNLTAAEKYDLKRNFAPQPGSSKMDDKIIERSADNSFFCNEISLIDNTFSLNDTNFSQLCTQSSSKIDTTIPNDMSNIWMPRYNAPSRENIENSLSEYNIPQNRFQRPFYSQYSDVTKKVDIGCNVLKIPSTSSIDFEEFESSSGFIGIEKWRKEKFKALYSTEETCKNLRVVLADHSKIIIMPVNLPPSQQEVIKWLKSKICEEKTPVKKVGKPRIVIPMSPGNSDDSFESMTLSPCTPEISRVLQSVESLQHNIESPPNSLKLSQDSPSLLRQGKFKKKGTLQRKVLFSQSKQLVDEKQFKMINLVENVSNNDSCQITGVSLNNTHGFQMSYENLQHAKAVSEYQYLTTLVVELHIGTRSDLNPDPQYDSIRAIFYSILNDVSSDFDVPREETGIIAVDTLPGSPVKQQGSILEGTGIKCKINYVKSEIELFDKFVKLIRNWDPDILIGFEIEMLSWGYLIERGFVIGINLPVQLSRVNPEIRKNKFNDYKPPAELKLTGRIILDGWRLFRHEIALQSYTFENLMYHILHQRVPSYSFKNLSFWWNHRSNVYRHITANYYITRVEGILKLIDQLDIIGRTCELARLFGIQFFEVLSRGSQFRVESMMLRLAKPSNYIPVSPSVQQKAKMRAPEFVPLILEPESRFYTDPVIVLDFQSLYPSIMIAYNYCFSTCIGRIEKLGTNSPFEFGAYQLKISKSQLQRLQSKLNFSPCGVGFVTSEVRRGILPRMLQEILETRLMVKKAMKENKNNKLLQRVLHNRQLGLKLIANVTYGYTSANFSGRMPCIEIGDSVVSKGRETLERAIKLIEATERWQAKVVYGDTDSLFVLVTGRSREEAFKIGEEIAEAVTNANPAPVKLKLEKVYHPCILQTKKRYVGYMYESSDQIEPEYNAKGIETVRRDGCPAVAKMLEKSLRILFDTRNVSVVKRYICRQFEKLLSGRASIQDLVFAREYRGAQGYRPGACVPALELAKRWIVVDKRKEPRRKERVPYIIVHGPPGVPLIRLVRSPRELMDFEQQMSLRPNAIYYITRVIIPALNRCFSLIGVDIQRWYNEMPRKQLQILPTDNHFAQNKKGTISQYFATMSCVVCNNQTHNGLCEDCFMNSQQTVVVLQEKLHRWERSYNEIKQICQSCCDRKEQMDCISLDCPVLYRLNQIKRDIKQVPFVRDLLLKFESR